MTYQHSIFPSSLAPSSSAVFGIVNVFHFMCRIRRKPFWWSEIKSISYFWLFAFTIRFFLGKDFVFFFLAMKQRVNPKKQVKSCRLWRENVNITSFQGLFKSLLRQERGESWKMIWNFLRIKLPWFVFAWELNDETQASCRINWLHM